MKKKLISLLLVLALVVGICPAALAEEISAIDYTTIEVSIEDLQDGVTIVFEDSGNGDYVARQLSSEEVNAFTNGGVEPRDTVTFHCGLSYNKGTHRGQIHWTATGNQLTRVQAEVFCRDTSILFHKYYFSGDIDGYSDLSGRYDIANGVTSTFDIPSDVEKVQVGWKNAYVTTVTHGMILAEDEWETLTLAKLPHSNV